MHEPVLPKRPKSAQKECQKKNSHLIFSGKKQLRKENFFGSNKELIYIYFNRQAVNVLNALVLAGHTISKIKNGR
jgi:hypothetical protein